MFENKTVRINPSLNPEKAAGWFLLNVPEQDQVGTATDCGNTFEGEPHCMVNGWTVPEELLELVEKPLCDVVPCTLIAAEAVEHPPHYNTGKIEVIDFIEDQKLGFHLGNVVKYVTRAAHKNDYLEDLRKAKFYLEREIERAELT